MSSKYARARFVAGLTVAFLCGLIFASGFNLTRFGWAQSKVASKPSVEEVKGLMDTQTGFESIADHVTPAVVSIQAEHLGKPRSRTSPRIQRMPGMPGLDEFFHQFEQPQQDVPSEASGTGFIVSKDGYILTNNHVVADADRVTVKLLDNRTFTAKVIGKDPTTDVAVVKVDANDLPTVALGDDSKARVGQWVVAIGNPLGLDFTVTAGIVSAKNRQLNGLLTSRYNIQDYIQTDAAINPGNSGGPLVNIRGEVIGINSAIASQTGYYAGYGFAIPISLAKEVMDDIIRSGHVRRAVLGVSIQEVEPNDAKVAGLAQIRGAKVSGFDPADNPDASPGKRAGLEIGDIIIAAGGHDVSRVSELQRVIRDYKPGDVVPIDVMRFGQKKTVEVRLGEPPADRDVASNDRRDSSATPARDDGARSYDKLGITVEPVTPEFASQAKLRSGYRNGLLVTDVSNMGPSYRQLFADEDIVVQVLYPQRRTINSTADLQSVLNNLKAGDLVTLLVYDFRAQGGGATRSVTLKIGG